MPEGNVDLVRGLYGCNWLGVGDRERGLAASRDVLAPHAEARISPEIGERTLHGVEEFAVFVQGLEQDFSDSTTTPRSSPSPRRVESPSAGTSTREAARARCRSRPRSRTCERCATGRP